MKDNALKEPVVKVAVVAHSGTMLGGGLPELRRVLAEFGVREPMWTEVDKSRKAPKRVRAALAAGAELVDVRFAHKVRYELDGGARTKTRHLKVHVLPGALTVCVPQPPLDLAPVDQ